MALNEIVRAASSPPAPCSTGWEHVASRRRGQSSTDRTRRQVWWFWLLVMIATGAARADRTASVQPIGLFVIAEQPEQLNTFDHLAQALGSAEAALVSSPPLAYQGELLVQDAIDRLEQAVEFVRGERDMPDP